VFVPGPPKPKGRPRFRVLNGRVMTYTPKETAAYEQFVAEQVRAAATSIEPYLGPVQLNIGFYMHAPESIRKRFRYHRGGCEKGPGLLDEVVISPVGTLSELWQPCKKCKPDNVAYRTPVLPTSRPDLDNLEKSVSDGIQKSGVIKDDSQVVEKRTWKEYSSEPGVHLSLVFGVEIGR
jgi:Holliday junction resolvase RusA-like endonuclease